MPAPLFHGCAVALITPFRNGEIDFDALRRLVDFQLQNGTDAIVACGTTGEPSTMTADEWERTLACVVESVGGRVPVIAGTGGNCTADVIGKARVARAIGADAQLCVTPYYNKTTQAGLIAHYTAVADDGALPLMVYNVPARTGLNLLPETLAGLAGHERIIAVKEASGDVAQIADMLALCGDQIVCYSGSDELTVPVGRERRNLRRSQYRAGADARNDAFAARAGSQAKLARYAAFPRPVLRGESDSRQGCGRHVGPLRKRGSSPPSSPIFRSCA